ncbi:MAG: LysR family transcriptional regulator [Filimonas sp.]|nr:LysR family transcriptional regulator [Filimonas sp.]
MTTQQISYFLALADELHYWQTSYKLNITQSALSRQIKALEEELNIELFTRSSRKVELTSAGSFLQKQWKPLLEKIYSTVDYAKKINKGEGGTIVINHPGSIAYDVIPDLLTRVSHSYPNVKVELVQVKGAEELELIKNFRGDVIYSRHLYETDFLESKQVNTDNLSLVLPEKHVIRKEADIVRKVLQQQRFILPNLQPNDSYSETILRFFKSYKTTPEVCFVSDFGSTILSLVQGGLGISIMPHSFSHTHHPGVRFLPIPFSISLYAYWRKEEENALVRNIVQFI